MKRLTVTLLFFIVLLSGIIRISNIGTNPPSISWDEASIGYNAYSILKTGRDEHGKFFPLDTFAAFGDYKPPVPVYLTVPTVALFGLNELAVRLPSALAGTLTVLALYFLVVELFRKNPHAEWIGLTASGVLAITPWHIMLSRAGFEANIALLFMTIGVWWVMAARENPRWFYVCWVPFVVGVYTFNSARYAGPLLAAGLVVYVWKHVWAARKEFLVGVVIALLGLAPIIPHLLSKQSRLRFDEVSIFTDLNIVLTSNARRKTDGFSKLSAIFDNRRLGYAHAYLIHFLDNVEPRFLFMHGDGNPKFSIQDTGELLLVSAPFLVYGILRLFQDAPGIAWLFVWWLIVSIAPAAVARETPHALRIENGLPVYMIVTAYGLVMSIVGLQKRRLRAVVIFAFCLLFTANFFYFWHNLTAHYPTEFSGEWQYGYKQAIRYIDSVKKNYDTVVLTESIGRPYIYVLFYDKVDPNAFWKSKDASFDAAGFYNVYGFDKYRFVNENVGKYTGRTLYVLAPKNVPTGAHVLKTITVLNGTPVLVIFDSL
jgi:4-amino-4-deoxy-L-arabinose transferase-like glycosyltransferase